MAFPGISLEKQLEYSGDLYRALLPLFKGTIPAVDLTDLPCISARLTRESIQKISSINRLEGNHAAARQLLDLLHTKPGWFEPLMEALDSPAIKLQNFKPEFLRIKAQVDQDWNAKYTSQGRQPPHASPGARAQRNFTPGEQAASGAAASSNPTFFPVNPSLPVLCSSESASSASSSTYVKQVHTPATNQQVEGEAEEEVEENPYATLRIPQLDDESWYVGSICRDRATRMLADRCVGTFLVRFNAEENRYSLYVQGTEKVLRLIINSRPQIGGAFRHYLDVSEEGFDTIQSLVNHFSTHPFTTSDDLSPLLLAHPVHSRLELAHSETVVNGYRMANLSHGSESNV